MVLSIQRWKQLFALQLVPLAVLGVSMLWPYYNMWDVLTGGTSEAWFVSGLYRRQFSVMGLALLGFVAGGWLALKRSDVLPLLGAVVCGAIYGVAFVLEVRIGGRFVLYGSFFLHLALARWLAHVLSIDRIKGMKPALRWALGLVVLVGLGMVLNARVSGFNTHYSESRIPNGKGPVQDLLFVQSELKRGDVLLAEPSVAWAIPAISNAKVVAASKIDPIRFADNEVRKAAVAEFLTEETSLNRMLEIAAQYGATHLLLPTASKAVQEKMGDRLIIRAHNEVYELYELNPG